LLKNKKINLFRTDDNQVMVEIFFIIKAAYLSVYDKIPQRPSPHFTDKTKSLKKI